MKSDLDISIRFSPKETWGSREVTGTKVLGEDHERTYYLHVMPTTENTRDEGTIVTVVTYVCYDHVMTFFRRLAARMGFEVEPKEIAMGTVEIANQQLITNGDINYGVVANLLELARQKNVPIEERILKALLTPVAHDYLRLNAKLQELNKRKPAK